MKKYIKPEMAIIDVSMNASLLVASTGVGSDGIDFGGIDHKGSLEAEIRKLEDIMGDIW